MGPPPKKPICRYCNVEMHPVIASFAERFEPEAIYDDPRAGIRQPTGDYYCPKCNGSNCWKE